MTAIFWDGGTWSGAASGATCAALLSTGTPQTQNTTSSTAIYASCENTGGDQARVHWGDGSPDSTIALDVGPAGTYTFNVQHTWAVLGTFTPTCTLVRGGVDISTTPAASVTVIP